MINSKRFEMVMPHLRYHPGIWLEGFRISTSDISVYTECPSRNSNWGFADYKCRARRINPYLAGNLLPAPKWRKRWKRENVI